MQTDVKSLAPVTENKSLCPKRKFSSGSNFSVSMKSTLSVRAAAPARRFSISFGSLSANQIERGQAVNDAKKRHTIAPEPSEPIHDLQVPRKEPAIQRTKLVVFRNLFHVTPSEARREKRAISQWKNMTKELMYCDILSHSSDTSVCSEDSDLLPARSSLIRQFILQELISTEESYLSHLHRVTTALLTLPCAIQPIFGAFPRLIRLSRLLIQGFKDQSMNVSDVFRKHEEEFEVYIRYACSFEKNRKRVLRTEIQSSPFRDLIQQWATDKASDRLGLGDYMILPIQRIARYCLLLKELKKYTNPMDIEYSKIDVMLKSLTGLALAMNNVQKKLRR
ncbi:hypothetical protein Unana1_03567 [Umbelopsis nana]